MPFVELERISLATEGDRDLFEVRAEFSAGRVPRGFRHLVDIYLLHTTRLYNVHDQELSFFARLGNSLNERAAQSERGGDQTTEQEKHDAGNDELVRLL